MKMGMVTHSASAIAHPNIAFIKYWGNRDNTLRLPANGSISMNLEGLETHTRVKYDESFSADELWINGRHADEAGVIRASRMLDEVRQLAGIRLFARVESQNNFPLAAGIASSASGFAALALAASHACGVELDEAGISRLARHSSGSACRSIPGGFVEWMTGMGDEDSYAVSIAPPGSWDLVDCIVLVSIDPKTTGSSLGHSLAGTSPLQPGRVEDAPRRLAICRKAILGRDFSGFASIVEEDSNLMHAVMMTSHPPLFYWQPATFLVMQAVREARAQGLQACYTVDAGPNVHVLCEGTIRQETVKFLESLPGVQEVRQAEAGGPARVVDSSPAGPHS
jgi:diphosphomevalonate decarboxylase